MLSQNLNRVGANLVWMVADRFFRMLVGVFVLGYVARYLQAAQFGQLNYAISLTAVFAAVASLGIEGIVIRELVKAPEQTHLILGTACVMRLFGGLFALMVISGMILATGTESSTALPILVVSLAFLPQCFEVIDLWFQKNIRSKLTVIAKALAVFAGSMLKIALVLMKAPLLLFCGAFFIDALLSGLCLIAMFQWSGSSIGQWRYSAKIARGILRDSWPLILSGVLVAVYMRVEQILVMNLLGPEKMGIYSASGKIVDMWNFIPVYIMSSIYPLMVEKRERDPLGFQKALQSIFDLLTGLGFGIAIVVTVCASFIIPLIYGPGFEGAIPILLIQAWSAPIIFSGSVRAQYLLLENTTIYHTWSALIGIAINVSLALWLMPHIQARGAALAALIGYFASAYLSSLLFPRLRTCGQIQTKAFLLLFRLPWLLRRIRFAQ